MPIEIRELHINMSVNERERDATEESLATEAAAENKVESGERAAIIAACVEEVLNILKRKKER